MNSSLASVAVGQTLKVDEPEDRDAIQLVIQEETDTLYKKPTVCLKNNVKCATEFTIKNALTKRDKGQDTTRRDENKTNFMNRENVKGNILNEINFEKTNKCTDDAIIHVNVYNAYSDDISNNELVFQDIKKQPGDVIKEVIQEIPLSKKTDRVEIAMETDTCKYMETESKQLQESLVYVSLNNNTTGQELIAIKGPETPKTTKAQITGTRNRKKQDVYETKTLSCDKCEYVAKNKTQLTQHGKRQHDVHPLRFKCNLCDKHFCDKTGLKTHKNTFHAALVVHKRGRPPKKQSIGDNFQCYKCEYIGKSQKHLNVHQIRCHSGRFECDECGKFFGYNKCLTRHKQSVHVDPQYFCKDCNQYYKTKWVYDDHVKCHQVDGFERSYTCVMCYKSFSIKQYLALHIKTQHVGIKEHFCDICGKSFTTKRCYLQHSKIHTGNKHLPYIKCDMCFKSLCSNQSYLEHMNLHTGMKPNICKICGEAFTHKCKLRYHERLHDPPEMYRCEVCNKIFSSSRSIKAHLKSHTGSMDHTCNYCGKTFTQLASLIRHERVHSNSQPYQCSLCMKTSHDPSIIRRHVILVHKKDPQKWQDVVLLNVGKESD